MSFNCTGCGLCCTRMGEVLKTVYPMAFMNIALADFPYKVKEDGSCEMFRDNQCMVYENRPLVCNIERMADEMDLGMTKKQWYEANYAGCEMLQKEAA